MNRLIIAAISAVISLTPLVEARAAVVTLTPAELVGLTITIPVADVYLLDVVVSGPGGSTSAVLIVTVNDVIIPPPPPPPLPTFTVEDATGLVGEPILLSIKNLTNAESITITIPDGATLSFATPPLPGDVVVIEPNDSNIQAIVNTTSEGQYFVLECGVYREQTIIPKNGQTFDGQDCAELNGARIVMGWQFDGTYWTLSGLPDEKRFHGSCADGSDLCKHREDLFVDGVLSERVATLAELGPGAIYREGNTIFLLDDPRDREVELGLTSFAFGGSAQGVVLRDIVVTHYANDSQSGAVHGKSGIDWQIINVTATWNHGGGLYVGPGARVVGGLFADNGQIGVKAQGNDIVIDGVEIARNNYAGYSAGWEAGGTKFVRTDGLVVRNSCVYDNIGPGLWTDIDNINTLYEDNVVFGNFMSGIKHEISYAAIIRRNTVADNGWKGIGWMYDAGIMIQNSPDVEVYGNFVQVHRDYGTGITIAHQNRGSGAFGPHDAIRNDIHDNTTVFLGDASAPKRPSGGVIGGLSGMGRSGEAELAEFFESNRWEDNEYVIPPDREYMPFFKTDGASRTWAYIQEDTQLERRGILTLEQRQTIALECLER